MLRLWNDRITLAVAPETFSAARYRRTLSGWQLIRKVSGHLNPQVSAAGTEFPIVDEISRVLTSQDWEHATVQIVIANSLVNGCTIPWDSMLLDAVEEQQFALAKLREVYGNIADDWRVALLGRPSYGHPRLAFGLHKHLIQRLYQCLGKLNLSVRTIEPQYVTALNFWRTHLSGSEFSFFHLDNDRISAGLIQNGQLRHLHTERCLTGDIPGQLKQLARREVLFNHHSPGEIPVYLFDSSATANAGSGGNTTFKRLTPNRSQEMTSPDKFLAFTSFR